MEKGKTRQAPEELVRLKLHAAQTLVLSDSRLLTGLLFLVYGLGFFSLSFLDGLSLVFVYGTSAFLAAGFTFVIAYFITMLFKQKARTV